MNNETSYRPSNAFVMASWIAMASGVTGFLAGLWNADMGIEEKGYYFAVITLALFAAVSVQKSVRDRLESVPVSNIYYGICWLGTIIAIGLLGIGLYNATSMELADKGFYAMAFLLSMFGAITVQKNTRDQLLADQNAIPLAKSETKGTLHSMPR